MIPKDAIEILKGIQDNLEETRFLERCAIDMAIEALEEQRPQGEWEHWGSPFSDDSIANSIVCSLCKARYVEIEDEVFNFCPNCGADMRKERGEANE